MNAYTEKEKSLIIKNVLAACRDITKLNKRGYNFLYLANGFIAHYNLQGFIDYYTDKSLKADILQNQAFNQWRNFSAADRDFDYYMAKKQVYNAICDGLKK